MNAPVIVENIARRAIPSAVPSLERKRVWAYIVLIIGDIAAIMAAFALGGFLYRGDVFDQQALLEAQLFVPLYLTIALYQRVFSIRSLTDGRHAALRVVLAVIVAAALLNFLAFYAKFNTSFSRGTFTLGLGFSALFMASIRFATARKLRNRWGPVARNIVILDDGGPALELPHAKRISVAEFGLAPMPDDPHMRDGLARSLANQELVIVSAPLERRSAWSAILKSSGIHAEIVSNQGDHFGILGITQYRDQKLSGLIVSTGPLGLRARVGKRIFDIVTASLGLLLLWPVMLVAALAIKITDGGPVLFVQQRSGRGNRLFPMLKFRSMKREHGDHAGRQSASRDDPRTTRVGRFLRRSSIDELPQLFNVLAGNMSIVGPRPHAVGSLAGQKKFWEVDSRYWTRHSLKPGLTGLAQVRGFRGATDSADELSQRLQSDLEYIANWSLVGDLLIMVRTMAVLTHRNAY